MSNSALAAPALDPPAIARLEPLRPMPVRDVKRAMDEYQQGLQAILDDSDWQVFAGRDGREGRFVKRSGWRKIATWFGLDLLIGDVLVERDADDEPIRARVKARVVAPNGRVAEDIGACSMSERRFSKPEHDLVATAATRALNRATSDLVGKGEVSAEEVGELADVEPPPPPLPAWAEPADIPLEATMRDKLAELVGEDRMDVLVRAIHERYGYVPNVATGFVNAMHSMLAPELKLARNASTDTTTE